MDDYFIFDGIDSRDKGIYLINYTPIFHPSNKRNFRSNPGGHGSIRSGKFYKNDVTLNLEIGILGDSYSDVLTKVEEANPWLNRQGKLQFWDSLNRYYVGEPTGEVTLVNHEVFGLATLQFVCDPIKYGKTIVTQADNLELIQGNSETRGIFKITIPFNTDHLEIVETVSGARIYIEDSFLTGDIVIVSMVDEFVTKNGGYIKDKVYLETDYFELNPGACNLVIDPVGISAELTYTERWL